MTKAGERCVGGRLVTIYHVAGTDQLVFSWGDTPSIGPAAAARTETDSLQGTRPGRESAKPRLIQREP